MDHFNKKHYFLPFCVFISMRLFVLSFLIEFFCRFSLWRNRQIWALNYDTYFVGKISNESNCKKYHYCSSSKKRKNLRLCLRNPKFYGFVLKTSFEGVKLIFCGSELCDLLRFGSIFTVNVFLCWGSSKRQCDQIWQIFKMLCIFRGCFFYLANKCFCNCTHFNSV